MELKDIMKQRRETLSPTQQDLAEMPQVGLSTIKEIESHLQNGDDATWGESTASVTNTWDTPKQGQMLKKRGAGGSGYMFYNILCGQLQINV